MRFYIYLESDYELDADSIEEKNKVGTCLLILLSENCGDNKMIFILINCVMIFMEILCDFLTMNSLAVSCCMWTCIVGERL